MKKITQNLAWSFLILGGTLPQFVFGLDSEVQTLAANTGAVDFFEITCTKSNDKTLGDTDHLNFKLVENDGSAQTQTQTQNQTPPQLLNATLTKLKLSSKIANITASNTNTLSLKGGNGAYTLGIDTLGTNPTINTIQNYTIQYQCLNATGQATKGSSTLTKQNIPSTTKTLANGKTAKYVINCAKNVTSGNTDSLKVTLFNKTFAQPIDVPPSNTDVASTGTLAAQVIGGIKVKNTVGANIDLQNGNGIYNVMVNSPTNTAKSYHFEYTCLNSANISTQTSPLKKLQDK
ncbi:MAG: hypothetical protein WCG11_09460 [Methylococcaceae bacterium]